MSQVQAQTQQTSREYRRSPQVVLRLSRDERKSLFTFAKTHVRKAKAAIKEAAKQAKLEEKEAAKQAKVAEKEAAKQAKLEEKEAAKQAKVAKKEAAKQAKLEEKEAAKQAKVAEKEVKAAAKRGEKLATKMAKKERDDASRECVKRLTGDEKVELVERYLVRVVGEDVEYDDIDELIKKVKTVEWRKMILMNWNEQGESYIPEVYKKVNVVEVGV